MTISPDDLGNLLRDFYRAFGTADEGPPRDLNVADLLGTVTVPPTECQLLSSALSDNELRKQFSDCRQWLEDLMQPGIGEGLLHELSPIVTTTEDGCYQELANGVFWFSLAATLDKRREGLPITPFDNHIDLPLPLKARMTVVGSLVLRLYIALVYMRHGPLRNLIAQGKRAGNSCCGRVNKLLDCDYVRRMRNALSHGTFSSCIAGIAFRDDRRVVVATPGFMDRLCMCLMLIQLNALAAGCKR